MQLPYDVGVSPTLGIRGMIASRSIRAREVIERCPVVLLPLPHLSRVTETVLTNYYFDWDSKHAAITLGYGSLINHSFTPNAAYRWDYAHKKLVIYAIMAIRQGEEVTINYNGTPNDTTPLPASWTDFHHSITSGK